MTTPTSRRPAPAAAPPTRALRSASEPVPFLRPVHRGWPLARICAWAAVAAGPVALIAALALPRSVVAASEPRQAVTASLSDTDPSGIAALFCDLWLHSDADETDGRTARAVQALAPGIELPTRTGAEAPEPVGGVVAVRSAQLEDGSWSVVVAAQFGGRPSGGDAGEKAAGQTVVRYFAVPVVSDRTRGAGTFTVTGPPAQVAAPGGAVVKESRFEDQVPADGALASTLSGFFEAYLTGVGEVGRYLSPGTELAAVEDSGYASVAVDQAVADSRAAAGAVPGDGAGVRVQVHVTASDGSGRWPLMYAVAVTARAGRWEVSALQAGAEVPHAGVPASSVSGAPAGGAAK